MHRMNHRVFMTHLLLIHPLKYQLRFWVYNQSQRRVLDFGSPIIMRSLTTLLMDCGQCQVLSVGCSSLDHHRRTRVARKQGERLGYFLVWYREANMRNGIEVGERAVWIDGNIWTKGNEVKVGMKNTGASGADAWIWWELFLFGEGIGDLRDRTIVDTSWQHE